MPAKSGAGMELNDSIKWRIANLYVLAFIVTGLVLSIIPARPLWFGFVTDRAMNGFLSVLSGAAIHYITKALVQAFAEYTPATPLQARRANEQIKLMATFSNAIAVAVIAILAIGQLVRDAGPDYFKLSMGVMISVMIHAGGRNLVALLKAEKADDLRPLEQ